MATKNEKADLKDLHLMLIVLGVMVCSVISFCAGKAFERSAGKRIEQQKETDYTIVLNQNHLELYNPTTQETIYTENWDSGSKLVQTILKDNE